MSNRKKLSSLHNFIKMQLIFNKESAGRAYSHSIVPGGFEVMSYTTR